MEIPYTVKPHPETGINNAKLGIWLFLASEVMLFGGLFSAYVFLRMGADDNWPVQILDPYIGMLNTAILIISSLTVVLAWVSIKLRKLNHYFIYMGITILCGIAFVGIKGYFEYGEKFNTYGVFVKDGTLGGYEIKGRLKKESDTHYYLKAYKPKKKMGHTPKSEYKDVAKSDLKWKMIILPEGVEVYKEPEEGSKYAGVLKVAKEHVRWASYMTPKYNSFTAIYYTMTGLHALHVIGGVLVMIYFWIPTPASWGLWCSSLYHKDPEHFASRIEVTGLFWHFVDLVWIFLFPLLYLL